MKFSTERIPGSQLVVEIEVDDERVEKAKASAFRRLAAKTRIPGFRAGKAPRAVLERHLGEHAILHEAIDRLLPEVYGEALEQEKIDPIDQAGVEMVTEEPLVVKFTVPVKPSVDLGDYASLRVPQEPVVVEPERIQEGLEELARRYATVEPVARPIEWGDIVTADVRGEVEGKVFVKEEDTEFPVQEGRVISMPGFTDALVGREKGAEFEIELTVPEDAPGEALRGKQAKYQVVIKEVKQEVLPELDDPFAQQVGEGFSDLGALRTRVEDDIRQTLEGEEERRYHDSIVEALVQRAEIDYPPVIVERETERMLREQASAMAGGRQNDQLERYLQQVGKSESELRSELRPMADERVQRSLVLSQVAEAEHIDVKDAEVETEIDRLTSGAGGQADEVRRLFSTDGAKESLRRSLVSKGTLERLVQIASADEAVADEAQTNTSQDG